MNKHYVYSHERDGDVVYIGKGKDSRAWSPCRTLIEHTEWALSKIHSNEWSDCVTIIKGNLTSDEAYALEARLIKEIQPLYNDTEEHICVHCGTITKSAAGLSSHMRNSHNSSS